MVGLRGVGKTVLLDRMREEAEAAGTQTLLVEAPEDRSLPAMLAPRLREALLKLSRHERARDLAQRALRGLAGFARALKVKYQDIEVGVDFDPEPGLADNGDLEQDLTDLLLAAGTAAKEAGTALSLFVDELQYVDERELAALITALHRAAQRQSPVVLVGAGLPQLRARTGRAKSYAERLFDFPEIGPLAPEAARSAIEKPARAEGVAIAGDALQEILARTRLYPCAPALPAGMGQARLGCRRCIAHRPGRRRTGIRDGYRRSRRELLPGSIRPPDPFRAALPARHGRARSRASSVGRRRANPRTAGNVARSDQKPVDRKGHGLEPEPRRYRLHRAAVRSVHAAHHAGRRLAVIQAPDHVTHAS